MPSKPKQPQNSKPDKSPGTPQRKARRQPNRLLPSQPKPTAKDPERTTEEAKHTVSKMNGDKDSTKITVETPKPNKYAKKKLIGADKPIGKPANYVNTVGLGKLKVITAHGRTDV